MEKKGSKNNCFFVIRAWHMFVGFASVPAEKKKLKKRKQDDSDSKSRLLFVETKTSQSTELFFLKEATKSCKTSTKQHFLPADEISANQFTFFFHIFVFLKRKPLQITWLFMTTYSLYVFWEKKKK